MCNRVKKHGHKMTVKEHAYEAGRRSGVRVSGKYRRRYNVKKAHKSRSG